jgi:hypothetical protein
MLRIFSQIWYLSTHGHPDVTTQTISLYSLYSISPSRHQTDEIRYPMRHLNQLIKEDTEFFIACQKLDANSSIAPTK